jgi:SpoVK/Ycf46/Vps4 family AAA+-type ATPase
MITYTKDEVQWHTDEVIPRLFAERASAFQSQLDGFEKAFAVWREQLKKNTEIVRLREVSLHLQQAASAWDKVQLPERQRMEILRGAELFEAGDPAAPSGLLLSGPSGTGKSLIGRTLAETIGCDFQMLSLADLKEEHLGASGKRVRAIWDRARTHQPAVIFLDECEGILGRRGAAETDTISTDIVHAFLAEWDGLRGQARVWVIGATNRRDMLDDAILSRFGWDMEVALPGPAERQNILFQEVQGLGLEVEVPPEAAALTQGMSGRDLKQLARSARAIAYPQQPTREHFLEAIDAARKSRNTRVDSRASWDTLVLDATVLENLQLTCTLLRDAESWTARGVSIPRSLLLIGPPGVGKTQISRTLANESGLTFLAPTTADIKANFLGQSGNRMKQLFERARSSAPAILFLDELDVIAPDRSLGGGDQLTDEIVGQLLQEMDGIRAHDGHVFLMAATNRFEHIDPAIRSRFSDKLVIPLPDREGRIRLLRILLQGKNIAFPLAAGTVLLADLTEGKEWSGRDLENWVRAAEQKALRHAVRSGGPETFAIGLNDFEDLR